MLFITLILIIWLSLNPFLKSLHLSFKSQTLENEILILSNKELSERNGNLETKLLNMLEKIQKEC